MADDLNMHSRRERRLAYAGAAGFVLLTLLAVVLWARVGEAVYITRILSQLSYCL